jgi:ice-binding like protein/PEP-CTERM motif-containing protein
MLKLNRSCLFCLNLLVLTMWASVVHADSILGPELTTFSVLGHTTVTNVPTSTVAGNVGVAPGAAITGSGGIVFTSGTLQADTALAQAAQNELVNALLNTGPGVMTPTNQLLSSELAGLTLFPGVYSFSQFAGGFATLTGTSANPGLLTLDGQGNANAAWVFQMASTLSTSAATTGTASSSKVSVINAGPGAGIFWNVGSSATIGTYSVFEGNILALTSISMNTGATDDCGRALASTGQVSLQMNTIGNTCSGILSGSNGLSGGLSVTTSENGGTVVSPVQTASVPEPGTLLTLGTGIAALACLAWKKRTMLIPIQA